MAVTCASADRVLTASISGEVDHHGAKEIMWELDRYLERDMPRKLTIDMSGVTFMDSSGIAVVLRAHRRMLQLEGGMTVINVPRQAQKVFQAAGLGRMIRFQ